MAERSGAFGVRVAQSTRSPSLPASASRSCWCYSSSIGSSGDVRMRSRRCAPACRWREEADMHRRLVTAFVAILCALAALPMHAQTGRATAQGPAFDVTSIKPNTSASPASTIGFERGGRFRAVNEPVVRLIQEAFATPATPRPQIVGAPGWIESDRFDVEALADANRSPAERQMMLRAMLADRFRLASHVETRALPVYNLVRPSPDAKLGNKLRLSDGSCAAL